MPNNTATASTSTHEDNKRTIWNMDAEQLHDGEIHPNYLTPNASRRHGGGGGGGVGGKSGLVKPQWSTPPTPVATGYSPVRSSSTDKKKKRGVSPEDSRRRTSFTKSVTPKGGESSSSAPPSERNSFYDAKEYSPPAAPLASMEENSNDKSTQTSKDNGCVIL